MNNISFTCNANTCNVYYKLFVIRYTVNEKIERLQISEGKRHLGRPRHKWKENNKILKKILEDVKYIQVTIYSRVTPCKLV